MINKAKIKLALFRKLKKKTLNFLNYLILIIVNLKKNDCVIQLEKLITCIFSNA